jgi:hypothetical protein
MDVPFFIMGFLIPVVGFVMYFLHKEEAPGKAMGALRGGFFQLGLSVIYAVSQLAMGHPLELQARKSPTKPVVIAVLPKINEVEAEAQNSINQHFADQKQAITCTKVTLARQSDDRYTGSAALSDGSTASIVMSRTEGSSIWDLEVIHN